MEHEHSPEDLEVARILRMLPHLVWEAQHPRPSTHSLRWGSRKRRSAGNDEPRPPPTHSPAVAPHPLLPRPPLHHPAAAPHVVGTPNEKRTRDDSQTWRDADASEEKATAYTGRGSDPSAPGTSSPETPLDFCPSGEEPDAEAKHSPPVQGLPPSKNSKSDRRELLAERIDLLIHTRTDLKKEAAEARKRLEAERWRYSELVELRIKLEEESLDHQQQLQLQLQRRRRRQLLLDPPPACTVRTTPPAHDYVRPNFQQKQPHQHLWNEQWVDDYPLIRRPTTGFSNRPDPAPSLERQAAAPAGELHRDWVCSQALGLAGNQGGSRPCKIPDLNACADEDLAWS